MAWLVQLKAKKYWEKDVEGKKIHSKKEKKNI